MAKKNLPKDLRAAIDARGLSVPTRGGIPLRVVPLHPDLIGYMQAWKEEDKDCRTDHIIHWCGKPIRTSIKKAWKATLQKAGARLDIRPYALRHKAVSDMLSAGADVKTVAEIVGHADPSMTMRVYQQTNTAMKNRAIFGLFGTSKKQE